MRKSAASGASFKQSGFSIQAENARSAADRMAAASMCDGRSRPVGR